jgi:hypothetical protein
MNGHKIMMICIVLFGLLMAAHCLSAPGLFALFERQWALMPIVGTKPSFNNLSYLTVEPGYFQPISKHKCT